MRHLDLFAGIGGLSIPIIILSLGEKNMANKYTALPVPPKDDLESLYFGDFKSQKEIADVYGTTQRVVFSWFRKLGIKSRVAYKRNQKRENNSTWGGNDVTYAAFHYRVVSLKGRPRKCEVCGTDDKNKTYDWACVGDYKNVDDFKRMCRSCHWKHDKTANNFPNHKEPKSNSSKNVKKHK